MTLVTADFDEPSHLNSDRVKFQTKDATDVRIQRLVFAPGAVSGWHHHPGMVLLSVESGAVTFTHSDCSSKTYGPGLPNGAVFAEGGDDPTQERRSMRCSLRRATTRPSPGSRTTWFPARDGTRCGQSRVEERRTTSPVPGS